jgi:hypothetical protein
VTALKKRPDARDGHPQAAAILTFDGGKQKDHCACNGLF